MQTAPTYLAAIVMILLNLQSLVGLEYTSTEWTAFLTVAIGIFVGIRQLVTGRSTLFGGRPDYFTE